MWTHCQISYHSTSWRFYLWKLQVSLNALDVVIGGGLRDAPLFKPQVFQNSTCMTEAKWKSSPIISFRSLAAQNIIWSLFTMLLVSLKIETWKDFVWMRKPILDLAERLENNHRWGAGKVLEQWVNLQPWRLLTASRSTMHRKSIAFACLN